MEGTNLSLEGTLSAEAALGFGPALRFAGTRHSPVVRALNAGFKIQASIGIQEQASEELEQAPPVLLHHAAPRSFS